MGVVCVRFYNRIKRTDKTVPAIAPILNTFWLFFSRRFCLSSFTIKCCASSLLACSKSIWSSFFRTCTLIFLIVRLSTLLILSTIALYSGTKSFKLPHWLSSYLILAYCLSGIITLSSLAVTVLSFAT